MRRSTQRAGRAGVTRDVSSNQEGLYRISALPPGSYDLTVEATGFRSIRQTGIVLEVDQRATLDFALTLGSTSDTMTVKGNAPLVNASDASVSTVIGNRFVENMPLNGRSFSSLIELTPGVVIVPASLFEQGQFSVNGQRPDANYFMVDGVSANLGNAGSGGLLHQGGAGQLPSTNAFGGMSNLVSLDALEEFRIQTSTFAPEYGRTPGAQVSVVTKSGTNTFHGAAFEYFRNDKLDANDWFANATDWPGPNCARTISAACSAVPSEETNYSSSAPMKVSESASRTSRNTYVPSLASRQNAAAAVQPLLNAFPLPNGPAWAMGRRRFVGGLFRSFYARFRQRQSRLSSSAVGDHLRQVQRRALSNRFAECRHLYLQQHQALHLWFAVCDPREQPGLRPSDNQRGPFQLRPRQRARELHARHFRRSGAPAGLPVVSCIRSEGSVCLYLQRGRHSKRDQFFAGKLGDDWQRQINVTDNLSRVVGAHQLKFGMDFRRITSETGLIRVRIASPVPDSAQRSRQQHAAGGHHLQK